MYDERPWLHLYGEGQPTDITPEFADALSMFAASVARNPDGDAIRYFDGRITYRELDELTDAFAVALLDGGFAARRPAGGVPAERARSSSSGWSARGRRAASRCRSTR